MTPSPQLHRIWRRCLSRGLIPLTIALCAYFAARGAGELVLSPLNAALLSGLTEAGAATAPPSGDPAKQAALIAGRDIFCSDCLPSPEAAPPISGHEPRDPAQLFATVIPEQGDQPAFAALYLSGPGSWRLVAAGDELRPGVQVIEVTSTGIVVARDGAQQLIALPGAGGVAQQPADLPPEQAAAIQRTGGDTSFTIQRRAVVAELRRVGLALARGKEAPLPLAEEGGGLQVTAAGSGGLVSQLGLRQGDLLLRANGQPLRSLQDLIGRYSQLISAEHLTLGLRRGRARLTHVYTIR